MLTERQFRICDLLLIVACIAAIILICLGSGCEQPPKASTTTAPRAWVAPPVSPVPSTLVRLYVFMVDGEQYRWRDGKLQDMLDMANLVWGTMDIHIEVAAVTAVPDPTRTLEIMESSDEMRAVFKQHNWYRQSYTIPIYCVGRAFMVEDGLPVEIAGGCLHVGLGDEYIVLSSKAPLNALAHELGHAFGLAHPWESSLIGPRCDQYDCDTPACRFNVMGGCPTPITPETLHYALDEGQRALVAISLPMLK